MKKQVILITVFLILYTLYLNAAIITVSNNTNSPGQFTNLQTAIDAAAFNDTILVAGSTTSYGNIAFGKPLVLIGAGYNNPYGSNTTIGTLTLTRQTYYVSASNSKILGFIISSIRMNGTYSGGNESNCTIDNTVFERCSITDIDFGSNDGNVNTFNNDTIRNCLIKGYIRLYTSYGYGNICIHKFNNFQFHNNIFCSSSNTATSYFYGYSTSICDMGNSCLRNNIFLNHINNCFSYVKNMILENNIFYGAEPQGGTNCVFTKNLTYMCVNNTIPGSGNLGSGNIVNYDPQFVNYPVAGGVFSYSYDFHLKNTSHGKNAGTDGTDIGIYGGMMPFEVGANPYIPQMIETTLPTGSSVPAGGTLNVHFKAKKQN